MRKPLTAIVSVLIASGLLLTTSPGAQAASLHKIPHYASCAKMHTKYPHGIGKPGAVDKTRSGLHPVTAFFVSAQGYATNKGLDRDRDGVACEA